jgi:hypothetical protein
VGLRLAIKIRIRNRHKLTDDRKVDLAFLAGVAAFAVGFGWIYPPLLLIVGGASTVAIAWTIGHAPPAKNRRDHDADEDD